MEMEKRREGKRRERGKGWYWMKKNCNWKMEERSEILSSEILKRGILLNCKTMGMGKKEKIMKMTTKFGGGKKNLLPAANEKFQGYFFFFFLLPFHFRFLFLSPSPSFSLPCSHALMLCLAGEFDVIEWSWDRLVDPRIWKLTPFNSPSNFFL